MLRASVLSLQWITEDTKPLLLSQSKCICMLLAFPNELLYWKKDIPASANYCNMVFPDTTLSQVIGSMTQFSGAQFPFQPESGQNSPDFHFHFLPLKLISQTITQACFNCFLHPYPSDLCLILSKRSVGGRNGM